MTSFFLLSELARSFFLLWALMLCLICIFGAVISATQKRLRFLSLFLLPFGFSYFLWQVMFDLHLFDTSARASAVSRKLGALPWADWMAALVLLSVLALILLLRAVRYGKRSITPATVKLCLDQMPCGVCCWYDNGRVLFSNICMNRLSLKLTHTPLLNGNIFYQAVSDGICTVGESVWRFQCRDIFFDGEKLHEMIASDITAEYAETQALKEENKELSRLKQKLQAYSLNIEETVRRQEILQAKINIHDQMNKLMLSTMAADKEDAAALDKLFSQWEQNALFLRMQADGSSDKKAVTRINDLAQALGICLSWRTKLPITLTEKQRELFFTAAQEAVINAAKHAQAKNMEISFTESDTKLCCRFKNDGTAPSEEVDFAGGLKNLAMLAGEYGAFVSAKAGEAFILSLTFIKNQ